MLNALPIQTESGKVLAQSIGIIGLDQSPAAKTMAFHHANFAGAA
ncbi:hypothetical protein [Xenorhabdus doucetiae]|nr:hypothetical protein [Xenorhabdus sp. 3]